MWWVVPERNQDNCWLLDTVAVSNTAYGIQHLFVLQFSKLTEDGGAPPQLNQSLEDRSVVPGTSLGAKPDWTQLNSTQLNMRLCSVYHKSTTFSPYSGGGGSEGQVPNSISLTTILGYSRPRNFPNLPFHQNKVGMGHLQLLWVFICLFVSF